MLRPCHLRIFLGFVCLFLGIWNEVFSQYTYKEGWIEEFSKTKEVLVQDKNGFLWGRDLETGSTLFRFDGYEYQFYPHDLENEYLPSGPILGALTIVVTRDDQIWSLLFGELLNVYDPQTQVFRSLKEDLLDVSSPANPRALTNLCEEKSGDIWLSSQSGLFHYSKSKDHFTFFESEWISAVTVNSRGNVFCIGKHSNSLLLFDRNSNRFSKVSDLKVLEPYQYFSTSFMSLEGGDRFYIPNPTGGYIFDSNDNTITPVTVELLPGENIATLTQNKDQIFLATTFGRILLIGNEFEGPFVIPAVIQGEMKPGVNHVMVDNEGIIWVSSNETCYKIYPDQGIRFVPILQMKYNSGLDNFFGGVVKIQDQVFFLAENGLTSLSGKPVQIKRWEPGS